MRKYSFSVDGFNFERINKAAARMAYVDRFTVETPTAETLGKIRQYDYKYMEV